METRYIWLGFTIAISAIWLIAQGIWLAARWLDRKQLRPVEAHPEALRLEQRQFFFSVVVIGIATAVTSFLTGIAASWTAVDLTDDPEQNAAARLWNMSGMALFQATTLAFGIFLLIAFGIYFRRRAPWPAELLADINAASAASDGAPSKSTQNLLRDRHTKSKENLEKLWSKRKLDQKIQEIFSPERQTRFSLKRFCAELLVALSWQLRRPWWILTTMFSLILSLALNIVTVASLIEGRFLIAGIALFFAILIILLQICCARLELTVQGVQISLNQADLQKCETILQEWQARGAYRHTGLFQLHKRLIIAVGPQASVERLVSRCVPCRYCAFRETFN